MPGPVDGVHQHALPVEPDVRVQRAGPDAVHLASALTRPNTASLVRSGIGVADAASALMRTAAPPCGVATR